MAENNTGVSNVKQALQDHEKALQDSSTGIKRTFDLPLGESEDSVQQRAAKWIARQQSAQNQQQQMWQKWSNWYGQLYADVNTSSMAMWRSKVFLPIVTGKVWDLVSKFSQYKPGWDISIRSVPESMNNQQFQQYITEMEAKMDKVRLKLEYDYDDPLRESSIADEINSVMLDAVVAGTGLARVDYKLKEYESRQHLAIGEDVDTSIEEITTSSQGYNDFKAVNIFNVFVAPSAKSLQESPYLMIHGYETLSALQNRNDYYNLDKIQAGDITSNTASYERTKFLNAQNQDIYAADNETQYVETYECWDKATQTVTIYAVSGTAWTEIYRSMNYYWHGKYPFQPFYIRRKPHYFWGESIYENSESLQSAATDIFNHYIDQMNMSDGMIAIEENSVVEPYIIEPGGELRYSGETPKQFKFPEPNPALVSTAMNQIMNAVESVTISQYASGVPNSATDSTQGTATGITRLMEAAAEKVGMMRANFRRSWKEVGDMWNSNTQQFMDYDIVTSTDSPNGRTYEIIRPADVLGVYNVKIDEGSFEPVSKDERRSNFLDFTANMVSWANSSAEQAQATGNPNDRMLLDYRGIALKGSEVYGENYNNFILDANQLPVEQAQDEVASVDDSLINDIENELGEVATPADPISAMESIQPANSGIATADEQNGGRALPIANARTINAAGQML